MILLLAFCAVLAPVAGYLINQTDAIAAEATNPRSDYWRMVREGNKGYSAVRGQESNELIQSSGNIWRQLRNGPIAAFGGLLISLAVLALGGFYLYRGKVELTHPRSGQTVERWSRRERILHWYTATLFILLTITGLSLLYGRLLLIPLIGHHAFSAWAEFSKVLHNFTGPLFIVGLVLMAAIWFRHNFPAAVDIQWIKDFGGMIGDKHPSAGRMNAGEKMWFWALVLAGLGVAVTGLILDFPNFGQEREVMQISELVHAILAIILIAFSFAHIYIGTVGTEGALEGMVSGRVDTTWARQHHDLWYKELVEQGKAPASADPGEGTSGS